jgi:hypothetical protein
MGSSCGTLVGGGDTSSVLVGKTGGKRQFGKHMLRQKDNVKVNFKVTVWEGVD